MVGEAAVMEEEMGVGADGEEEGADMVVEEVVDTEEVEGEEASTGGDGESPKWPAYDG